MHAICLQLLNKPIAYVHTGIPSYPSVKSPLLLPLLLPLPIPTSFPFPPSHLPPFPIAPLSISSSPCPPLHCQPPHPYCSPSLPPRCPLPDAPSLSPTPPSRLPSTPPHPPLFLSTLPTSHFPLPSLLSALASPSAFFSPLPLPPQAAMITN